MTIKKKINFNKPYLSGKELNYIKQAVESGKISGDGLFTKRCQEFFKQRYAFPHALMTTSCTDALEMAGVLMELKPSDEVICPSFTFSSTSNAFVMRGATIRFADSLPHHPNLDPSQIESLINSKTKAIVVVHYAGVAVDMNPVMALAKKHRLFLIEDAAQAVESTYYGRPLGGIGDFSAFSFHETKNIMAGEGGLFVCQQPGHFARAEIIREKGTNRSSFFRGEVDRYGWVDLGSSYLPSDMISAFLFAQLENLEVIQKKRIDIWNQYLTILSSLPDLSRGEVHLPVIPSFASNNAHCFYLVCASLDQRTRLISQLKARGIYAAFHYLSLHKSPYYSEKYSGPELKNADRFSDCLVRLPLYFELTSTDIEIVSEEIIRFMKSEYQD